MSLILCIAVFGLVVWLITEFVPMPPKFKMLIYVIAGLIVLVYTLQAFGFVTGITVPHLQ